MCGRIWTTPEGMGITSENRWTAIALRGLAVSVAAYGVLSLFALNVRTKLLMQPTLDFWDFEAAAPNLFGHLAGIVGLCALLAHYAWKFVGTRKLTRPSAVQKSVSS